MRQHQVWRARQEEGREALDVRRGIAGDPHIGEAEARKICPEPLHPPRTLLPRTESGVYVTLQISTLSPRWRCL